MNVNQVMILESILKVIYIKFPFWESLEHRSKSKSLWPTSPGTCKSSRSILARSFWFLNFEIFFGCFLGFTDFFRGYADDVPGFWCGFFFPVGFSEAVFFKVGGRHGGLQTAGWSSTPKIPPWWSWLGTWSRTFFVDLAKGSFGSCCGMVLSPMVPTFFAKGEAQQNEFIWTDEKKKKRRKQILDMLSLMRRWQNRWNRRVK